MTALIQHKRSTTAAAVPSSLADGEIAINETDGLLFYKDASGAVAKRSLTPEPGVQLYAGEVTNAANLDFDVSIATVGAMKGFILRISDAVPVTLGSNDLKLRFGTSGGIQSGSSAYEWLSGRTNGHIGVDDSDSSLPISDSGGFAASGAIDAEVLISSNEASGALWRSILVKSSYRLSSVSYPSLHWGMGRIVSTITMTTVRLLFSTGNISKMRYSMVGYS